MQFCLQTAEIKNDENVDCEVYEKPNVKKFTPQDMGKLLRSNHDDLLEVQYDIILTCIGVVYLDQCFTSACSGWASL